MMARKIAELNCCIQAPAKPGGDRGRTVLCLSYWFVPQQCAQNIIQVWETGWLGDRFKARAPMVG
jgi:hypothetical protein